MDDEQLWAVAIVTTGRSRSSGGWRVVNGVDLKSTVHLQLHDSNRIDTDQLAAAADTMKTTTKCGRSTEPVELIDMISAETCVLLCRLRQPSSAADVACNNDEDNPLPSIRVDMKPESALVICGLSTITQAKHVELYDSCRGDEYLTTVRSNLLDVGEMTSESDKLDHIVYTTSIDLVNHLQSITIKFLIPKTSDTMWLYGMLVRVRRRCDGSTTALSNAKMNVVESTLAELDKNGVSLSENAKRFASLMRSRPTTASISALTLETLIAKCVPVKEHLRGVEPSKETTTSLNNTAEDMRLHGASDTSTSTMTTILASVLQSSLKDLERRFYSRMDARLALFEERQTRKLDRIIELLEKRHTHDKREPD